MCPGRGAQNTHTGWMRDAAVKELIHRCLFSLIYNLRFRQKPKGIRLCKSEWPWTGKFASKKVAYGNIPIGSKFTFSFSSPIRYYSPKNLLVY